MQNAKCGDGMGKRLLVCIQTVMLGDKKHSFANTIHHATSSLEFAWVENSKLFRPLKTCESYSAVSAGIKKFLP